MRIINILVLFVVFYLISCGPKKEIETFPEDALNTKIYTETNEELVVKDILTAENGNPTIVKMWAGWCGDCIKSLPDWHAFQSENPNVNYVLISVDHDEDTWKNAIEKYDVKGVHYRLEGAKDWKSNAFTKSISLEWIPRYLVLNKDGEVVSKEHIIEISDAQVTEILK